jgi:hypothetical protein
MEKEVVSEIIPPNENELEISSEKKEDETNKEVNRDKVSTLNET